MLERIARKIGVEIREAPLDGAAAQLIRNGNHAVIIVSERVTDPAARRFSIAHELGHLVLGHPSRSPRDLCKPRLATTARERALRDYEAEANAFASELLMPSDLVKLRCEISPVDLVVPRQIAKDFSVSILASARRFCELASERCAAVFSADRQVKWVAQSATFTRTIARGRRIDPSSLAWDFYAHGEIADRPQAVPADAWLDTSADVELVEHSIYSRELRTVLSMLWVPDATAPRLGML